MRFSKVTVILQGFSFFVATSAISATPHLPDKEKVFYCSEKTFKEADFAAGKQDAIEMKENGHPSFPALTYRRFLKTPDLRKDAVIYGDSETTYIYGFPFKNFAYEFTENNQKYLRTHILLLDNLNRVSAIMTAREKLPINEGETELSREIKRTLEFCPVEEGNPNATQST